MYLYIGTDLTNKMIEKETTLLREQKYVLLEIKKCVVDARMNAFRVHQQSTGMEKSINKEA